ncbi:hypothetical protein HAX54_045920, partial [Datura stramonium]|nr:hypothetical protein [Datura stramonium]
MLRAFSYIIYKLPSDSKAFKSNGRHGKTRRHWKINRTKVTFAGDALAEWLTGGGQEFS